MAPYSRGNTKLNDENADLRKQRHFIIDLQHITLQSLIQFNPGDEMLSETSEHFLQKHVMGKEVRSRTQDAIEEHDDLLIMLKKRKDAQIVWPHLKIF